MSLNRPSSANQPLAGGNQLTPSPTPRPTTSHQKTPAIPHFPRNPTSFPRPPVKRPSQSTFPSQVPAITNSALVFRQTSRPPQTHSVYTTIREANVSYGETLSWRAWEAHKTHWKIASARTPAGNFRPPIAAFPSKTPVISSISSNFLCLHFPTIPHTCSFVSIRGFFSPHLPLTTYHLTLTFPLTPYH